VRGNLNNLVLAALVIQHEYFLSGNELTIGGNGLSNNTYTGGLGIGEGGSDDSRVTVAANDAIPLAPLQHLPVKTVLTIDGGIEQTLAGLTGAGTLRLMGAQSVLTLNGATQKTFAGAVSGSGVIHQVGTWRLSARYLR
jgi:hypothetical protein